MIESFKRVTSGNEKLWIVFWMWGFIGPCAIGLGVLALMAMGDPVFLSVGPIVLSLVFFLYYIWLLVGAWRCAFNVNWKIWGYVVRVLMIIHIFSMGFGIWKAVNRELKAPPGYSAPVVSKPNDAQATAPLAVVPSQDASAAPSVSYTKCKEKMEAYALSNNVDPQAYVTQNIGWLNDCVRRAENQ